jgi:cytochrome P450
MRTDVYGAGDPGRFEPGAPSIRPPAPRPREVPPGPFELLRILRRNPIETWTRAHFERPILTGTSLLGESAVVSDPAAIRRILLDNAANYEKDALQRRILAPGLGKGLLVSEGEMWRAQRRTLASLFSPRTVGSFWRVMAEEADVLVARWIRRRAGRPLEAQAEMAHVTLNILGRTLFSGGLGRTPQEFMDAITRYFDSVGQLDPLDLFDMPDWLPRVSRLRSRRALGFFEDAVTALVDRRRAELERGEDPPRDLLTLLLTARDPQTGDGLSDEEVRANVVTFIGAGHETTANALTWALYLLSLSPDWQERLADEAMRDAANDLPDVDALVATRAVIEEAMRLYPPVASLSRTALGPDDLAGRRIRKGTFVMVAPWVLHRHKRLWEQPNMFDPGRFMPGRRETIDRFAYLPFGAGPRVCIGASFALQEATIILSRIMRSISVAPQPGYEVVPVQRITLRPRGGLPLIVTARKHA